MKFLSARAGATQSSSVFKQIWFAAENVEQIIKHQPNSPTLQEQNVF